MKQRLAFLTVLFAAFTAGLAAVPTAEKLLPSDTLAVLTVPDWDKARLIASNSPFSQLWADAAMRPFREKFEAKWKTEVTEPMERDLGAKLGDLTDLIHGQLTLGILKSIADGNDTKGGWVLLADAKDKKDALAAKLGDLRKKWVDAGKEQKLEKVRDLEFTTFIWTPTNRTTVSTGVSIQRGATAGVQTDPDPKPDAAAKKTQLSFGMADSLLLVGGDAKDFEKILARLGGGMIPALDEVPEFQANASAMFREAYGFAWLNFKIINDLILKNAAKEKNAGKGNPFVQTATPDAMLAALGLTGVRTLALNVQESADGTTASLLVGAPESGRRGVLKVMSFEAKDAAPPPFVPADTVKFSRNRLDLRKTWATVEAMLGEISPPLASVIQMGVENAGKDKDPNFDLRKMLVNNLGDDLITIQKPPRGLQLDELQNPPTLYLLGSGKPEEFVLGVKAAMALLPPPMNEVTERDFLGRKVYAAKMAAEPGPNARADKSLNFARAGGYVALSTDVALLEEFLRNAEATGRPLRETAGLADAAQKIGGTGTGWFTFENQSDGMKAFFETLKKNPDAVADLIPGGGAAALTGAGGAQADATKKAKEWFDFSLLPEFGAVAKYFHFTVSTVAATPEGISIKTFLPVPPGLKK
ncbi:MAG: hypothetical protein HY301_09880 [Verrucomicrobia bacterium]|nr:hypothetical protein [Verrucomicrobiota bacterium]